MIIVLRFKKRTNSKKRSSVLHSFSQRRNSKPAFKQPLIHHHYYDEGGEGGEGGEELIFEFKKKEFSANIDFVVDVCTTDFVFSHAGSTLTTMTMMNTKIIAIVSNS